MSLGDCIRGGHGDHPHSQIMREVTVTVMLRWIHCSAHNLGPRDCMVGFQSQSCIPPFTAIEELWKVWVARYETIADEHGWTKLGKTELLLPKLWGAEVEFVCKALLKRVRKCYKNLF